MANVWREPAAFPAAVPGRPTLEPFVMKVQRQFVQVNTLIEDTLKTFRLTKTLIS